MALKLQAQTSCSLVTKLEPFDKKRLRIILEDNRVFVLYYGECKRYHISEGCYLEESVINEIRETIILKRAKQRCLHLLEKKRYTESKLLEKLINGGYDREAAQTAVDYAKSFHYVDDDSYAFDYIELKWGSESKTKVKQKLMQRGIRPETIESAFESFLEYNEPPDEGIRIRELLNKKKFSCDNADRAERQRVYNYLLRRGFSSSGILKEMGCFEYDDP